MSAPTTLGLTLCLLGCRTEDVDKMLDTVAALMEREYSDLRYRIRTAGRPNGWSDAVLMLKGQDGETMAGAKTHLENMFPIGEHVDELTIEAWEG